MNVEESTLYAGPADGQVAMVPAEQREVHLDWPGRGKSRQHVTYARCPVLSLQMDKPIFRFVPESTKVFAS